jgi:serine/threonine-protein kinase HipA
VTETLLVVLDDTVAGELARLGGGRLRFDYSDEYRARPGATPLSLSMPIQVQSHSDGVVTPWLWGLLPDNDAVLARWARQFHVSASSPFSLLATQIGEDCAGAVRFAPPERIEPVLARTGQVTWLSKEEIAQRLCDLREDATTWLGRDFTGQFSLAGGQAKTALLLRGATWGEPSGSVPTTHILKPAVAGLDDHDLNEHLCLDSARRAGLVVVRTTVERFGNESAVVVERYDRQGVGNDIHRVHQEDLCQALAVPPSRKYQNESGPAPGDIARLLRRAMPPRIADDAVRRFADALIWNWLIAGTDAHAKNYSVLIAGDQVRLAPLYDVASALPYGAHEKRLRFAMKIGGSYDVYPQRNPWPAAATELGLDGGDLVDRVRQLAGLAPEAFADAGKEPGVAQLGKALPSRLVDLVAGRAARCSRFLRSPGD